MNEYGGLRGVLLKEKIWFYVKALFCSFTCFSKRELLEG